MKQALILGAGAVGQVYAYYLFKAGYAIDFLVRTQSKEKYSGGLSLRAHNQGGKLFEFTDYNLITKASEMKKKNYDIILIAVASDTLREKEFVKNLEAMRNSTVIVLQPGLADYQFVNDYVGPGCNIISGLIGFISYQAPLPDDKEQTPAVAYWFPPLGKNPFAGAEPRVNEIAKLFDQAGLPANVDQGLRLKAAFASASLMCYIAALEAAGWRFKNLRQSEFKKMSAKATEEAVEIIKKELGQNIPFMLRFLTPGIVQMAMGLSGWVVPFDIEKYLEYHFSKVKGQTLLNLRSYIAQGKKQSLPIEHLTKLEAAINT